MQDAAQQLSLFPANEEPGHEPGFSVRVSGRARRLSIKVFPRGKVEVVVPKRTRARDVQAFVAEHSGWIEQARASFASRHTPEPFKLPARIEMPAIGRTVRVDYTRPDAQQSAVRYRSSGSSVVLSGRTDDEALCVAALKRWLAGVAKVEFEPRLRKLSALTGNGFKRMHVRGQRTCWGSHSSSGTISINYCLLFLEPGLLRYLMIHELCHARHMNHSRRFWRHVGEFEPDYRALDKRLSDAWQQVPVWLGFY